jgi:hypothetical protein
MIGEHLLLLGCTVRDRVTGFSGVATSVSFDLYGCIQVVVSPPRGADGSYVDSRWFDLSRLETVSTERAMPVPDFTKGPIAQGLKGCEQKPLC